MAEGDEEMPSLTRPVEEESPEVKLRQSILDKGRALTDAEKKLAEAEAKLRIAQTEVESADREVKAKRANWEQALAAYTQHLDS